MKLQTFLDKDNKVVARGRITELLIDLYLNDGTRYFSTRSDNYSLDIIKNLNIAKVEK